MECKRIGFIQISPVLRADTIFVNFVIFDMRDKKFECFPVQQSGHYMGRGIPAVKISHDGNRLRARRPDAENNALLAVISGRVRAEKLIRANVISVMEQKQGKLNFLHSHLHISTFCCIPYSLYNKLCAFSIV